MLRWNPKIWSVAAMASLWICTTTVEVVLAQSQTSQTKITLEPEGAQEPYYDRPDSRQPEPHLESQVIRRQGQGIQQQQAVGGNQRDYIQQQYQEMLAKRQGAAASAYQPGSASSSWATAQSQPRTAAQEKRSAYIGSYNFAGQSKKYVRKQLPPRMVPPRSVNNEGLNLPSEYSLNRNQPTAVVGGGVTPGSDLLQPQYQPRTNPGSQSKPIELQPRQMPAQLPQQIYRSANGQGSAPRSLPPIVQPRQTGAVERPVYYGPTSTLQQQPVAAPQPQQYPGAYPAYPGNRYVPATVQPASGQAPNVLPGSSQIPADVFNGQSRVTRARILMTQDGDPFGQEPVDLGGNDGQTRDPFGNLQPNQQPGPPNPFSNPPPELNPPNQNPSAQPNPIQNTNPNQFGDPFSDPPNDFQNPATPRNPFGQNPNNVDTVDPAPPTQNNNQPNTQQPNTQTPDVAPVNPPQITPENPAKNFPPVVDPRATEPQDPEQGGLEQREPEQESVLQSGPFENPGFAPTPIRPAPPRREFEEIILPPAPPNTFYSEGGDIVQADQPTFFESGFQKSNLYEGISVPGSVAACSYGCEDQQCETCQVRPRLVDRFNLRGAVAEPRPLRGGGLGGGLVGGLGSGLRHSGGLASRLGCGFCGQDCGQSCGAFGGDCGAFGGGYGEFAGGCDDGGAAWCSDDCFEPAFYVSIFGGYTQQEAFNNLAPNFSVGGDLESIIFNDGFGVGFAFGQVQGENLRTELEFAFRDNDVDEVVFTNSGPAAAQGSVQTYSGMFNVLWDFQPRQIFGKFRPYAGGGIGFALLDIDTPGLGFDAPLDSQSAFAFQFIGGISRPVSFRSDLFVEYRYFNADSLSLDGFNGSTLERDYETENIFFGLRAFF